MADKKKTEKQKTAAKVEEKKKEKSFHEELITRMLALATSGFGLVAALAWNSLIQDFVKEYIETRIPGSGLAYKAFYAILITLFAVLITYQLSKIAARFENKD